MATLAVVPRALQNRGMPTGTCTQRCYDHLKELVRTTGNIDIVLESGVPRYTAYGWLNRSCAEVVSLDVHDAETTDLQRDVVQLRRRNARLTALSASTSQHQEVIRHPTTRASRSALDLRSHGAENSDRIIQNVVTISRAKSLTPKE